MTKKYEISVYTADERYAGTDSNIFLIFRGVLGRTQEYRLNGHIRGNAFERNQTDRLTLDLEDIGDVFEIQLRSDCAYAGSDWRVGWIKIKNPSNKTSVFHINEWIKDTNSHVYNDSALQRDDKITKSEINIFSNALYYVPANTKVVVKDSMSVKTGYRISETKIHEVTTTTTSSCNVGIDDIKASISFALAAKVSDQVVKEISQETTKNCEQEISFPEVNEARTYKAVYIQSLENHKMNIGDFTLDVPAVVDQRAGGYIEERKNP